MFIIDQSDVDLRHSVANLIAVVLGCPSGSNHLWYLIFAPEKLAGTYMTGFMVIITGIEDIYPSYPFALIVYLYKTLSVK